MKNWPFQSWPFLGKPPDALISDATLRDASMLAAIHASGFERGWGVHEFEQLLADRLVVGHVARPGGTGKPAGFILSRLIIDEAEILTVAVLPSARKGGLGTALLHHHLGRLAGAGATRIVLEVAEDNSAAIKLYKRFGFTQNGRREAYYKRAGRSATAALLMERSLR